VGTSLLRVLDYIVTISFGYILYCVCLICTVVVSYCFVMCVYVWARARACVWVYRFCNVWVYCNMYTTNLSGVFPCFFLSSKANATAKLAKTGHGPHSSKLVVICVVLCIVSVGQIAQSV
jgi:hypothetical protein